MGLPLFKTPPHDELIHEAHPGSSQSAPQETQLESQTAGLIATRLDLLRSHSPDFADEPTSHRAATVGQLWREIEEQSQTARRRDAISRPEYIESRLRDAIGMEVENFTDRLYARSEISGSLEEGRVLSEVQTLIDAIRLEMRNALDERLREVAAPGLVDQTGFAIMPSQRSREPYRSGPMPLSAARRAEARPETPTASNPPRRRAFGHVRPSIASVPQVLPRIAPLSISSTPESAPSPHHVDRAATPTIRSAAPSPPAITRHVRARHSPTS